MLILKPLMYKTKLSLEGKCRAYAYVIKAYIDNFTENLKSSKF